MKTIKNYENEIKSFIRNGFIEDMEAFKNGHRKVLSKIEFLESIYMGDGKNGHFSEKFKECALAERTEMCNLSSAYYNLLRDETLFEKEVIK